MMNKETCTESVSLDKERLLKYKTFAVAFSYPDDNFFALFPGFNSEKERLQQEYDGLFRAKEIWLYGTEYLAKNEFQRSNDLSDIMGFYRAFGVEPDKDRPDALSNELEFMHYLIFKKLHAPGKEKASICIDAQRKFFNTHLYPAAKRISKEISSKIKNGFYKKNAEEMLEFLESDKKYLREE